MTYINNSAPYYDDFDPSKGYNKIMYMPGRVAQAREFTQAQSMIMHNLKNMSDVLLKNGSVVTGMGYYKIDNTITVEAGSVYVDGIIHTFDEQSLDIVGFGEEILGVKVVYTIVTEADDITLRDPAQGYANYSQPGAHRVKATVVLKLDDVETHTIYRFIDGILQKDVERPQIDIVSDMLARRTFDESGNFKVSGMGLWTEERDDDTIAVTVEMGKAYVLGYEVAKPTASRHIRPKSKSTIKVQGEPKVFKAGVSKYSINSNPVHSIDTLTAPVQVTKNVPRGAVKGGLDYLPDTPVVSIVSVKQLSETYVEGTDFFLNGDGIDWSLSGKEPDSGSTYQVEYRYNKTMIADVDYKLIFEGEVTGSTDNRRYFVEFLAGDKPVPESQFTLNYNYYLSRVDLVSIDRHGNIIFTEGQPSVLASAYAPINNNRDILHLGTVTNLPNSSVTILEMNRASERIDMEGLQRMVQRLKDVEYNQAITELDREAMEGQTLSDLKGIFSDSFKSVTKSDFGHPDYSTALDLRSGEIMIEIGGVKQDSPPINLAGSKIKVWSRVITSPITEKVDVEQMIATGTKLVNPYSVFNAMGSMNLIPAVDNWIDEKVITVEEIKLQSKTVIGWFSGPAVTETKSVTSSIILDEAITYMRQTEVNFTVTNLIPHADNLKVQFGGIEVSVVPTGSSVRGTQPGTIKADANGKCTGKFTIPKDVRTGTREVIISNDNNSAAASYTSNGRNRTLENKVLITRTTTRSVDPLAQTFQLSGEKIVSSVGLYFASKDPSKNVTVQIRDVVNGYPGQQIIGEKILSPSQVSVSAKGTVETRVHFDDPLLCNGTDQYCVVIMSDSDVYSMFTGELGGKNLETGATVVRQPYAAGVLFSSSNSLTWTAHQTEDLKFRIYTAQFASQGVIEFEPIVNSGADRLVLLADFLTPQNTGCKWEVRLNDEALYKPVTVYEDVDLLAIANKIQLRATFESSLNMSPILALDSFSLITFLTSTSGSYISKNTVLTQAITEVYQDFEAHIPSGCSVVPKFSYDNGTTWITPVEVSQTPVSTKFTKFSFKAEVLSSENARNFRARLDISAPNSVARPSARRFINIMK